MPPGRRPKLALRLALALSLFRRNRDGGANRPNRQTESSRGKKPWRPFLAVAALGLLAVVLLPATALANDPDDDQGWRLDEIYFVPPEPVPGRRIFVERLAVSGDTAAVTLRAAHDLDLKVRVFGGRSGKTLRMGANTTLTAGQAKSYNLSLDGPSPSFTFSWVDSLGRSGAVSLKSYQIPYPLPRADGRAVRSGADLPGVDAGPNHRRRRVRVHHRHPTRGCPARLRRPLQPDGARAAGRNGHPHHRNGQRQSGGHRATTSFFANGETRFTLPVVDKKATHNLEITADLAATLNVPLPPMLQTIHHPARTDVYTRRVSLSCGEGSSVTRTARVYVYHPEHVRAVETQRAPVTRTRAGDGAPGTGPGRGSRRSLPAIARSPAQAPPPTAEQTPAARQQPF